MPNATHLARLGRRIAAQHGWSAAKAFKAYAMSDADRAVLSQTAIDLLGLFPPMPDPAPAMSAALAVELGRRMSAPVHVVAGVLAVEGVPVLADTPTGDGPFESEEAAWKGHVWVMAGPYVVDMALFRLAASAQAPARLAKHVDLAFGPGKALYVDHWSRTARMGLGYEPLHVLGTNAVNRLMGEAFHLIRQAREG